MKQINVNGDLIYISDAEYERISSFQIIEAVVEERGYKNEIQKKDRTKIETSKAEKTERKSRTKPEREE